MILVAALLEDPSNRGNDLRYDTNISLEEAYKVRKNIKYTTYKRCSSCIELEQQGSKPIKCNCAGRGKVRSNQGFHHSTNLSSV